jgi:hypothetical protein
VVEYLPARKTPQSPSQYWVPIRNFDTYQGPISVSFIVLPSGDMVENRQGRGPCNMRKAEQARR